jgi:hypothetical protein
MINLYKVRYINVDGQTRHSHVKAHTLSEANVKAKRFVIKGGSIISVIDSLV